MLFRSGRDIEADILVTLKEALHGSLRMVTLRRPGHNGTAEKAVTYNVRIQPGVIAGQRIRLAGQGYPGHGGGAPGDLYLHVRFARHPDFTVQGTDLHFDLELAPWEAVLGAHVAVPALEGPVNIRIPAGTQSGQRLRVRGRGLGKEGARGDLFVVARIQAPERVTNAERELWEKLAKESRFNPRG